MRNIPFIVLALVFASCNTQAKKENIAQNEIMDTARIFQNDSAKNSDEAIDTTDYDHANYFIVVVDTGLKYSPLQTKMYALSKKLNLPIDTMGRHFNTSKNLIALADDNQDEMYAGDYYPRRDVSEHLSLEYLNFYLPDAADKNIALVAGIYEDEKEADSLLTILKRADKSSFKFKANVFVGCMH